ncbi:U7 snRNA-associated Sm-like protein LSm11 isoform X2 [Anthonomus grandis grandis]|uniref:U7 snRNA-associated Sm-like protein LSm11 isoform X2 n=1 Tax=Anthonomus grandis grandis TaxID=2921223 RepID=UPI002165DF5A|nr:U7 snRNA-associated Sm-like protein LSm11 isoform X2 [Anthonomus grandis grandis]
MADDQEKLSGTSKNSPEEAEKLNIYSEKFDPVAFLRSDKVPLPKSDATTFDNLAMWYSSYTNKKRGEGTSKNTKKDAKSDLPVRRWLPHQLPIQSMQPTRILKNVFTRMEAVQGPLALLRKYVNEKTRIKVVTRNEKGVRGYCIASLLAFDKHTNLVLDEVHEVWRRSIKVKKCAQFMGQICKAG